MTAPMWRVTDERLVPASKEGPSQIMLQRLQFDDTGEICFSMTQEPPPGGPRNFHTIVIGSDQMRLVRQFFAGFFK